MYLSVRPNMRLAVNQEYGSSFPMAVTLIIPLFV
nr:MAG TPA: hypothetical protein [Caudoviricetes sp.]